MELVIVYLSVLDVLAINQELLRRVGQEQYILRMNELESAVMRPQMHAHYGRADIIEQAAVLMAGIALAHAFLDANKRTALVSGGVFLNRNGLRIAEDSIEIAKQIEAIVIRQDDLDTATSQFVAWLRPRVKLI